MQCDRFREAVSARIDGEDPGLPDSALDAHLGACADCRAWQQRAHAVTRRSRLGGLFLDHDLSPRVLAAVPAAATGRRRGFTAQHLVAVAGALLLVWQARTGRNSSAGSAAAPFRAESRTRPVMPGRDAAAPGDGSPGFPGGGEAALVPVPDRPADGGTPSGDGSGAAVA